MSRMDTHTVNQEQKQASVGPAQVTHAGNGGRLEGKRVAMVMFSTYPFDPRPRRAADALMKEGASVELICLKEESSPMRERLNGIDVRRVAVKHRRGGKLDYAYQYSAFILIASAIVAWRSLRRRYALVYVHNMPDVLVVSALLPRLMGAKAILDQHDPMPELMKTIYGMDEGSFSVRLIGWLERLSIGFVDRVVTVNVACKRIFSLRSCRPEKISIVMNAPDERIFQYKARAARAAGNGTEKPFTILYHGSIVERNGLDLGIEALEAVRRDLPNVQLRICGGKTAFLDQVMETVRAKGLESNVRYLGPKRLEELTQEIEACDVGIIPNQRNAFTDINTPTRIFEYLALGTPVIAPSTLGIQDYFEPTSLFFFEPGNAAELAQQIKYVASHPGETHAVVERGQQIYLANTWTQQRKILIDMVSELLS
jgi:glycosyltransferase involved in cell wall biosynthesis